MEYRYRFCGFPIGVAMLPRFAAMVCRTITGIISSVRPAMFKIRIAKGTKVIKATSFVISILEKKQRAVRVRISCLVLFKPESREEPRNWNSPISFRPATTVIRENKSASVRKSI